MTTMLDSSRYHYGQPPHRKPLPSAVSGLQQSSASPATHQHSRTSSSIIFPLPPAAQHQPPPPLPPPAQTPPTTYTATMSQYTAPSTGTRRTLSNATTSTSSTTSNLRRSTSSRSNTTPASYVALMRKQKATVWCDRAQHDDPRVLAAQRAAKQRATLEVVGGGGAHTAPRPAPPSSSISAGVRSKIRHHGAPKASTYAPPVNLAGSGVPMRLSATEVDEGDAEDAASTYSAAKRYHQRSSSGRSSLTSSAAGAGARSSSFLHQPGLPGRFSTASTPPSGHSSSPSDMGDLAEETPVPADYQKDYFPPPSSRRSRTGLSRGSSGSSGERESHFGGLGVMKEQRREEGKSGEDLRRRGSVDDRSMSMSGVRLFVANPDLSD